MGFGHHQPGIRIRKKFNEVMVNLLKISEIDSTNDFAKKLLSFYPLEELNNTVICAQVQTKGRGVGTNKWISEPYKNLTFSIIHCPDYLLLEQVFYLSKAVSVAIAEFLYSQGIKAEIKWPNDILCLAKKCAGILIENSISAIHKKIKYSVIGIGLNVNQTDFPENINAISMKNVTGKDYDLNYVLEKLLESIFYWFDHLKQRRFDIIDAQYFSRLYMFDRPGLFRSNGHIFRGKIKGVDQYGRLILEIPQENSLKLFRQKEIEFLNA